MRVGSPEQRESFCSSSYLSVWGSFIDLFAYSFMLMGRENDKGELAEKEKLKIE